MHRYTLIPARAAPAAPLAIPSIRVSYVDGDPRPSASGPDMGANEVTRGTAARVSPAG